MSTLSPTKPNYDVELAEHIAQFFYDPLGYVLFAFSWGEKGTPLEDMDGPDEWQFTVLKELGERIRGANGKSLRTAISAGHGVGKSALMSMLILWFMSTRHDPKIICTAGTRTQLLTKLWPELNKWQELAINGDWYEWQSTSLKLKSRPNTHRADAIPWTKERSDAFAGAHATRMIDGANHSGVMYIFDEASAIADTIYETAEGGLTDPGGLQLSFGNPVRASGEFYNAFNSKARLYKTYRVDSRTSRFTNKELIEEWRQVYGEGSDFFKVRVMGVAPSIGDMQLIPTDLVERAMGNRHAILIPDAARALGVDVARFGADHTVIARREGNIIHPLEMYHGLDTMAVARKSAHAIDTWDPDTNLVDGTGLGAGVVDRLRQLGYSVVDVQFGSKADDDLKYLNKRAEMWGRLRDWLDGDVQLPNDYELKEQLIGLEYGYNLKGQIVLERKEDMKKRIGCSPDKGDAVALCFAEPVRPRRLESSRTHRLRRESSPDSWRLA